MSLVMFIGLAYLLVIFFGLIAGEYRSKSNNPDKAYTLSFKITCAAIFLIAVAIGVMSIFQGSVYFGVFWLSSILYLCFQMFVSAKILVWIDRIWALGFVVAGIWLLNYGEEPFDTLIGDTIAFLGIALFFVGSYLKEKFENN